MKNNTLSNAIPAVNFHLWQACNMRCKFCFATFQDVRTILPKGHLTREDAIKVTVALCEAGFSKITFVGGEPTLCPWIIELISVAKSYGLTTMMVTNGTRLNYQFLKELRPVLDWLCLSIDSLNENRNRQTGRMQANGIAYSETEYRALVEIIKQEGFRLKINTVVHSLNYSEVMGDFIEWADPLRWKVFQVLPIEGQNDGKVEPLLISDAHYENFLKNHARFRNKPVVETNNQMKGSYLMVDPSGRFFDNAEGTHNYSQPILEVGVAGAVKQVNSNYEKFVERGGIFKWH